MIRCAALPKEGSVKRRKRGYCGSNQKRCDSECAHCYEDSGGFRHEIDVDTTRSTAPLFANHDLCKALQGQVPELRLIGDGREAGMIVHAVRSGYYTAEEI